MPYDTVGEIAAIPFKKPILGIVVVITKILEGTYALCEDIYIIFASTELDLITACVPGALLKTLHGIVG
jgi:hypothetical protein